MLAPANATILVVEDDAIVREIVRSYLASNDIVVAEAADTATAQRLYAAGSFDLVLVDINLPDGSGFDLVDRLRQRRDCAVIYMTALGSPTYRLRGLENGDDYLVKPIDVRELLARVRAVLRRYRRVPRDDGWARLPVIEFGAWTLDLVRRELAGPAGIVRLTRAEFDLFAALVQAGNTPLSRDYLLEVVASAESDSKARTVDVMVSRIRRKLAAAGEPAPRIVTRQGEGYVFAPPSA